ncbi:MAG: xanthine dehydrogenase family protein subunit M [Rhodospirillales bacterium]|nr:xanthine dehydrogenase family protein subunit M [Rhodospirillales bacterium]
MSEIQNYETPNSVSEAADILAKGDVTILAGGTDLMVQVDAGRVEYKSTLMNIRRVEGLRGISDEGDHLRVGALTTITDLLESDLIAEHGTILTEAADAFASVQIRNAGTIGGNISNASPAGDTLVPLVVLNAEVELASKPNGSIVTRTIPIKDYFTGPGKTKKEDSELLVAVIIPKPAAGFVSTFDKFGSRPALDISTVSVGLGGVLKDGALTDVRVAFGAVAPVPLKATATEAATEGKKLDEATIDAIAATAKDEVNPIDDVRATAWYRKEMIESSMKKVLRHVSK